MEKKKILIISFVILIVLSIVISVLVLFKKPKEDEFNIEGINLPKNEEILKEYELNGLKIADVSLLTRDGISTFKADVRNTSGKEINVNKLYVVFYDGNKEIKSVALMNTVIKVDGNVLINIQSDRDLSNVTKIEYVLE